MVTVGSWMYLKNRSRGVVGTAPEENQHCLARQILQGTYYRLLRQSGANFLWGNGRTASSGKKKTQENLGFHVHSYMRIFAHILFWISGFPLFHNQCAHFNSKHLAHWCSDYWFPLKINLLKSIPDVIVLRVRDFGNWLSCEGSALMSGMGALITVVERSCLVLPPCEDAQVPHMEQNEFLPVPWSWTSWPQELWTINSICLEIV